MSSENRRKIAVFASGNGSNAENIITHFQRPDSPAEVALVICNRPDAFVLERAARLGVPAEVITRAQLNDESFFSGMLVRHDIDFIALAGFLLMIPAWLVDRYAGRMVNIHPSLLPKYGGKGMYGRHIHEAVVAAGETETGITVHLVNEGCDEGGIIFQARVVVAPGDTPGDVESKIHILEKQYYPSIIERQLQL